MIPISLVRYIVFDYNRHAFVFNEGEQCVRDIAGLQREKDPFTWIALFQQKYPCMEVYARYGRVNQMNGPVTRAEVAIALAGSTAEKALPHSP